MSARMHRILATAAILALLPLTAMSQERWEPVPGVYGGAVKCLLFLDANTVLAGGTYGGIFRSTDAGRSWHYRALSGYSVYDFLGLASGDLLAGFAGGVARSTDQGMTWETLEMEPVGFIEQLAADGNGTIFAGGAQGAFRSTDDGLSWEQLDLDADNAQVLSLLVNGDALYAGTNNAGLLRSEDGGDTWAPVDTVFSGGRIVALCSVDQTLIVPVWFSDIYCSTDNGTTWEVRSGGLDRPRINHLCVCDNGDMLASFYTGETMRSTDLGQSWIPLGTLPRTDGALTMCAGPDGTLLCGLEATGIARSTDDGATWTASAEGLANLRVDDLLLAPDGAVHITPYYLHWLKSSDHGEHWEAVDDVRGSGRRIAVSDQGVLYCAREYVGVFHSEDNGVTWVEHSEGLDRPQFRGFGVAGNGHMYVVLRDQSCYHLPPGADEWQPLGGIMEGKNILWFLNAGSHFFAGTRDNGAYRSSDNGLTWEECGGAGRERLTCLTRDGAALWAGSLGQVYRSTDMGDSWTQLGNETAAVVTSVAPAADGSLYISTTARGVLKLNAVTDEWETVAEGLPRDNVDEMVIDGSGTLFAVVDWNGVYRYTPSPTGIPAAVSPLRVVLHQNYPNPFNPTTTISYTLPRPMVVSLVITDALGREVKRISSRELFAAPDRSENGLSGGSHSVQFDASGLPSGVYFYRIEALPLSPSPAAPHVLTRKMMLLK